MANFLAKMKKEQDLSDLKPVKLKNVGVIRMQRKRDLTRD
jgi:hypothetical protein